MLVVLLVGAGEAGAGEPSSIQIETAHTHNVAGAAFFESGNFAAAQVEFEASYELTKYPDLLVNIAKAARAQGKFAVARERLKLYLTQVPETVQDRAEVLRWIDELDQELTPAGEVDRKQPAQPQKEQPKPMPASLAILPPRQIAPFSTTRRNARTASMVLSYLGGSMIVGGAALLGVSQETFNRLYDPHSGTVWLPEAANSYRSASTMAPAAISLLVIGGTSLALGLVLRAIK